MAKAIIYFTLVIVFATIAVAQYHEGDPCTAPDPTYYGYYAPHPTHCYRYLQCTNNRMISRNCSPGLWWNAVEGACDFPANVQCDGLTTQRSTTLLTTTAGTTITHSYTTEPDQPTTPESRYNTESEEA